MGRIALLANPDSGSGEAEEVERAVRELGAEVEVLPIQDAERAPRSRPDRILVAGGDGSIGLAARVAADAGVPLGVVPVGTANDFARAFDLPDDPAEAVRLGVEGRRLQAVEIGLMSGEEGGGERPFVNVASLGLPPEAAEHAHGLKGMLGPLAYAVGAVRAAASAQPVHCRVLGPGGDELYAGDVWQATVACSGHFGAGSSVQADPTDGMLDAVVVEAGSRIALARRAHGLRRGTLEDQSGVHRERASSFVVELDGETGFNVDGELCAREGTVRFEVAPGRVEVVVG